MSEQWEPGRDEQVLTRELRDTLVRRAEEGVGHTVDLATVQGRARRIRRNRRVAVAAGVAAVVAVIAPLAALGGQRRAEGPPVVHQGHGSALDVPYLRGSTLVLPDGTPRELPRWFGSGAVVGDDLYGVYGTEETGGNRLVVVHPDGSAEDFVDILSDLAINADGTVVAWSKENGDLVLHSAEGDSQVDAPQYFTPRGVVGDPGCVTDGTCLVFGDLPDEGAFVGWQLGFTLPPKTLSLWDTTPDGHVAYLSRRTPSTQCSAVYDPDTRTDAFETCERDLFHFSPDGSYVSAGGYDYAETGEQIDVAILDARTGDPVAVFTPAKGQTVQPGTAWEDASHLLLQVHDRDGWSVIRLGVDGSREVALGPYENHEQFSAFTLLAR